MVSPVPAVAPDDKSSTTAAPASDGAGAWQVGLCGGCCKSAGCAGCCCPCCVVGANQKMIETGEVVQVCDGAGGLCCLHAVLGGTIQGVAIFALGPLAGLAHFGSLVGGCYVRPNLREKYNIPGNACGDCCVHYWCGPCATCQEYEELTTRLAPKA
mmetsp:Transcript_28228/g.84282  ORF Transcript_28228/g.84282 Transcript_28228/m.84282 type:complete len:156 (+) Transcript_28228:47-514(+)